MIDKPLLSLKDANADALNRHFGCAIFLNVPNGIACPSCGKECVDVNRTLQLDSNPPQYQIRCANEACGWSGSRFI
jgi:hypothetical protein